MKREQASKQKAKGKFEPPADPLFKDFPRLLEAVADHAWDDGTPRDPWTISINFSGPMPTVQVNDKEEGRSCASTAPTVVEALEALETLLARGSLPWRYWGKQKRTRG